MRYCQRCLLPDSRPNIVINEAGMCTACVGHDEKEKRIDWSARRRQFEAIVSEAKRQRAGYDCIVPVSGGKDSWYQVVTCRRFDLKVLGVTWRTPGRTPIGQRNLDLLVSRLGIDHIDYTIDPDVERRFMKATYERVGSTAVPMHFALFAIPIRLAVRLQIPLIVWGENPQLEYGGSEVERLAVDLDLKWLRRHGVNNQTSIRDWVGGDLSAADLAAYELPDEQSFSRRTRSIFLGSFFRWDSRENAEIAKAHGFEFGKQDLRLGTWDFADIDCEFVSLHHFLKWYKFGITRAFDNLSVDIRRGYIKRDEAIAELSRIGLQVPDVDIRRFAAFVGKPEQWFWDVAEQFRNTKVWQRRGQTWVIPDFLVPNWRWT